MALNLYLTPAANAAYFMRIKPFLGGMNNEAHFVFDRGGMPCNTIYCRSNFNGAFKHCQ